MFSVKAQLEATHVNQQAVLSGFVLCMMISKFKYYFYSNRNIWDCFGLARYVVNWEIRINSIAITYGRIIFLAQIVMQLTSCGPDALLEFKI